MATAFYYREQKTLLNAKCFKGGIEDARQAMSVLTPDLWQALACLVPAPYWVVWDLQTLDFAVHSLDGSSLTADDLAVVYELVRAHELTLEEQSYADVPGEA